MARKSSSATHESPIVRFQQPLVEHQARHTRTLPWRETRDPYVIWVSEVMLAHSTETTVARYFAQFIARFPTVNVLAAADETEMLPFWSGLGTFRRAQLLHTGAREVVTRHAGVIPHEPLVLQKLPGVGRHISGMIASRAFGLAEPVLDSNIARVLTRWFAIPGDPTRPPVVTSLWLMATHYANHAHPGEVNLALHEFAKTECLPVGPQCLQCPVRALCRSAEFGQTAWFPSKKSTNPLRVETWVALVVRTSDGRFWLTKDSSGRFREALVPLLTGRSAADAPMEAARVLARSAGLQMDDSWSAKGEVKHTLSHATMQIAVVLGTTRVTPGEAFVPTESVDDERMAKLTRAILARANGD